MKRIFWCVGLAMAAVGLTPLPVHAVGYGFVMIDAGDLNGDGSPDLVAEDRAGSDSTLHAIDAMTGLTLWSTQVPQGSQSTFKRALASIKSVDGDEVRDIAYQSAGPAVEIVSGSSGLSLGVIAIATLNPSDPNSSPIAVAQLPVDLTGDGIREIVIGSIKSSTCVGGKTDTGFVYAVDPTNPAKALWTSTGPLGSYNFGWDITPLAHDYDADGAGDLLVIDHCRPNKIGLNLFNKGVAYIVSSDKGTILKEIPNPTKQPNPENEGNVLFGFDALETQDLDGDGVRDFFISETNIDASSGGETAVDLISGNTGGLLCRYISPDVDFDGFGASLAGGKFELGSPANRVHHFYDPPHDLLVGAPDLDKAYVVRIDPKHCNSAPVLLLAGTGAFGNRVALLAPPADEPGEPSDGYNDLLINSPIDGLGIIDRFSGKDGQPLQSYVPDP